MNKSVLLALALNAMTLGGPAHAQSQVAPETHSVGDIPDSQAFVRYAGAAGHYSLTADGLIKEMRNASAKRHSDGVWVMLQEILPKLPAHLRG